MLLSGDDFLNNALNGMVEFIAYFIVIVTMDKIGRKPLLVGCLLLGGIACLAATIVSQYNDNNKRKFQSERHKQCESSFKKTAR